MIESPSTKSSSSATGLFDAVPQSLAAPSNISEPVTEGNCVEIKEFLWRDGSDLTYLPSTMGIFAALYSIIIILGVFGNSIVIISVFRHKSLQSVRNLFIVALSTSDIVAIVFSGTITPITAFSKVWLFGIGLCKLVPVIQGTSLSFSSLTLTAIAIDRFILIIFPTRRSIGHQLALAMIAFNCLIAMLISLPMYFKQTLHKYLNFCGEICSEDWSDNEKARGIYGTFVLFIQFVIPFSVIFTSYLMIWIRLNRSASMITKPTLAPSTRTNGAMVHIDRGSNEKYMPLIKNASENGLSEKVGANGTATAFDISSAKRSSSSVSIMDLRNQERIKRRIRTNRMLVAMVCQFGLCWMPSVVFNILRDYEILPQFISSQGYFAGLATHCISISSTLWNPILYALFNEHFRTAFAELFRTVQMFICPNGPPYQTTNTTNHLRRWQRLFSAPTLALQELSAVRRTTSSVKMIPKTSIVNSMVNTTTTMCDRQTPPKQKPIDETKPDTGGVKFKLDTDTEKMTSPSTKPKNATLSSTFGLANGKQQWPNIRKSGPRRLSVISSRSSSLASSSLDDPQSASRLRSPTVEEEDQSLLAEKGDELL